MRPSPELLLMTRPLAEVLAAAVAPRISSRPPARHDSNRPTYRPLGEES